MLNYILKHLSQYLLLLLTLAAGVISIFLIPKPQARFVISLGLSFLYFFWGMAHHIIEGNLTLSRALDYFIIALLIFLVLNLVA